MATLNSFSPNYKVVPGSVLAEHREANLLTQADLAKRVSLDKKSINLIEKGTQAITPETALKLESVFGLPAHVWTGLEARYRESIEREKEQPRLKKEIPWLKKVGVAQFCKLGWLDATRDRLQQVRQLRTFFGVSSLDNLPDVWTQTSAAYRKSESFSDKQWLILAWLTRAERIAVTHECADFSADRLKQKLAEFRKLSHLDFQSVGEKLTAACAECGVSLVLLAAPSGTRVSGATRWLSPTRVLVQLSSRFKTNDQFWFTFFHEIGHVLLHRKKHQFIDFDMGKPTTSKEEQEADQFAADILIPASAYKQFSTVRRFDVSSIMEFSKAAGICPGIIVGRLQHERRIHFSLFNGLKQKVEF
jgi:HTH-type transcriptional regulator / antitoxin HigA